jgi:hypothetical protein
MVTGAGNKSLTNRQEDLRFLSKEFANIADLAGTVSGLPADNPTHREAVGKIVDRFVGLANKFGKYESYQNAKTCFDDVLSYHIALGRDIDARVLADCAVDNRPYDYSNPSALMVGLGYSLDENGTHITRGQVAQKQNGESVGSGYYGVGGEILSGGDTTDGARLGIIAGGDFKPLVELDSIFGPLQLLGLGGDFFVYVTFGKDGDLEGLGWRTNLSIDAGGFYLADSTFNLRLILPTVGWIFSQDLRDGKTVPDTPAIMLNWSNGRSVRPGSTSGLFHSVEHFYDLDRHMTAVGYEIDTPNHEFIENYSVKPMVTVDRESKAVAGGLYADVHLDPLPALPVGDAIFYATVNHYMKGNEFNPGGELGIKIPTGSKGKFESSPLLQASMALSLNGRLSGEMGANVGLSVEVHPENITKGPSGGIAVDYFGQDRAPAVSVFNQEKITGMEDIWVSSALRYDQGNIGVTYGVLYDWFSDWVFRMGGGNSEFTILALGALGGPMVNPESGKLSAVAAIEVTAVEALFKLEGGTEIGAGGRVGGLLAGPDKKGNTRYEDVEDPNMYFKTYVEVDF